MRAPDPGSAPYGVPEYGMLPPGASRAERQKLFLLAIACTAPLGFAMLILLLYVGGGIP